MYLHLNFELKLELKNLNKYHISENIKVFSLQDGLTSFKNKYYMTDSCNVVHKICNKCIYTGINFAL